LWRLDFYWKDGPMVHSPAGWTRRANELSGAAL